MQRPTWSPHVADRPKTRPPRAWARNASSARYVGCWKPVTGGVGLRFFFSSRRRHTRCSRDWSSDVCSSDLECDQQLFLHEHPFLERLPPVRSAELQKLLVSEFSRVVGALDRVAVRVARVAVGAPEFAADVGVERPEIDAGLLRRVEDGLGLERHELGAALSLVENREGGGTVWRYGVEQLQLPGPLR